MSAEQSSTSGVQALIDRLQQQGVEQGEQLSEAMVAAAKKQATAILQDAERQSAAMLDEARTEAERTRKSGEDAIRLAGRDTILKLSEELRENFVRKLQHLIDGQLQNTDFLRELILEIAHKAMPRDSTGEFDVEVLHQPGPTTNHLEDEQALREFVKQLGTESLQDGLTISFDQHDSPGIRVRFEDGQLEVDLTTETITQVLMSILSPRFRAIVNEQEPRRT